MENRSAAGLRRSAIAERLRLREEWSALKEINEEPLTSSQKNVLAKKHTNKSNKIFRERTRTRSKRRPDKENSQVSSQLLATSDILRGVVVLVDVGSESRALALRAALSALGATVVPIWSPLVTHLVWSQGGCTSTRARARALACHVVSPLWVEGCAGGRRLPERLFPAPPRPSDLPSPATLRRMLIRAERENISLANLLSDSPEAPKRLRISDETSHDTSQDTSREDKSRDSPGEEVRVNTAPRRALPLSTTPEQPAKSRRKLFTNREPDGTTDAESEEEQTPAARKQKMTPRQRKELAAAERMARRLLARTPDRQKDKEKVMRIVVTGMSRTERRIITKAIKHLNGVVQSKVDKRTDCVVLGSCSTQCPESLLSDMFTKQLNINKENENMNISGVCNIGSHLTRCKVRSDLMQNKNDAGSKSAQLLIDLTQDEDAGLIQNITQGETEKRNVGSNVTQLQNRTRIAERNEPKSNLTRLQNVASVEVQNDSRTNLSQQRNIILTAERNEPRLDSTPVMQRNELTQNFISPEKPRTVNALLGAVRGCRVVRAAWVMESVRQGRWIHHVGYEVRHLMKISQKARVERSALGRMKHEYAYNVFRGMKVHVASDADQRDAILQLLTMCGAVLTDKPCRRSIQDGIQHGTQVGTQYGKFGTQHGNAGTQYGVTQVGGTQCTINGGLTNYGAKTGAQNGGLTQNDGIQDSADITIGVNKGEICSRWVFDSIAASRMRTTRRYINN